MRRTTNNKTRKDTHMKSYKAMMVLILTYGSEIWTKTKKREAKTETAEITFLRSAPGYIRKHQIRKKLN
jgi:hypothetical protein